MVIPLGGIPRVIGSNPMYATNKQRGGLEVVPAWSHKPNDVGSIPTPATILLCSFSLTD